MSRRPRPEIERFSEKYRVDPSGCWIWTAQIDCDGYGQFRPYHRGKTKAHRWAYEYFVGPIPDGLVIDHTCRVRCCVNPQHMEPVTNGENVLRGESMVAHNARLTHCVNGHEFNDQNTRRAIRYGRPVRKCRACARESARRQAQAKRRQPPFDLLARVMEAINGR